MFVWLDDQEIRDPSGTWKIVRTAEEAIALLQTGEVEIISLDRDLGEFVQDPYPREVTGMDVVRWMVANKVFPKLINVHSMSSEAKWMAHDLFSAAPEGTVIKKWEFCKNTAKDLEEEFSQL